jgi:hypothetical protein
MRLDAYQTCRNLALSVGLVATLVLPGCGTTKMTSTPRTGTEQLLLTNAWDDALRKVDFRPLTGVPVYLDAQYVSAVDQGWVVSSIRQAMLAQGVLLRSKPEEAQWIVEARVGAYGTDTVNWMVGVPQMTVPPTVTGMPTGTIPEIAVVKRTNQQGMAKLALFAYDRSSGHITWNPDTTVATATAKDVYLGPLGPIQSGTIRKGPRFFGMKLPALAAPEIAAPPAAASQGEKSPFPTPNMSLPPATTDIRSFEP